MIQKLNGLVFIWLSLILLTNAELRSIPSYLRTCHKSDSDFIKCVVDTIEYLRPKIADGMPELNIPPLEPLNLGDLIISKKADAGIDIFVKQLKVYNATSFKIYNIQNKNYIERLNFEIILPKFQIDGDYILDGQILALPLKGNGYISGNFVNIKAKVKLAIDTIQRNDINYFKFKQINIKAKMGKGKIKFENLFNGNKELGDAVNDSINKNIVSMANEILPSIEKALEKKFLEICERLFEALSADQLLPN